MITASLLSLALLGAAADDWPGEMSLARVRPGARRHFFDARNPEAPSEATLRAAAAYLVPGDMVVVTGALGRFAEVIYVNAQGRERIGWIERSALAAVATPPPTRAGWIGGWKAWNADIDIRPDRRPGYLRAEGSATWGGHDPWRVAHGAINLGDFGVSVAPMGRDITFTATHGAETGNRDDNLAQPYSAGGENDCRVRMRLLGPYLIVEDNGACGGVNVTFSAVYRKSG